MPSAIPNKHSLKRLYRPVIHCLIFFTLIGLGFTFFIKKDGSGALALNDYIEYWGAGRLFLQGGNPYDRGQLWAVQNSLGMSKPDPLMMWNPPWTLIIVAPFAALPYKTAHAMWLLANMLLLLWAADLFWQCCGGAKSDRCLSWLAAIVFIPNGAALYLGQISPFLLFGLAGFSWGIKTKRWLMAGAATYFLAIKPHLFIAFYVFFLLWLWKEKLWKVLAGSILSLLIATACVCLYDTSIAVKYWGSLGSGGPLVWETPTWGVALQMIFPNAGAWLRFVPTVLGIACSFWLWTRWRRYFSWQRHLSPVLLLSIISSSFTWMFDWVVLFPVIVTFFVWFRSNRGRLWWLPVGFLVIELVIMQQSSLAYSNFGSIWLPPSLALLYGAGFLYAKNTHYGFGKRLE